MARDLLIYLVFNILALTLRTVVGDICKGSKQFDRVANSTDCTKFNECGAIDGVYTPRSCPHGTGFHTETKTCQWRTTTDEPDECFDDTNPPTENCDSTSVLPIWDEMRKLCVPRGTYVTEQGEIRPNCSDSIYEGKFIADPLNCAGYYRCENGVRFIGSCDETLYNFDPLNQRCARKENLPCSVDGSSGISFCEGKGNGDFVIDENICTAYFLCTGNNEGRQEFCAEGQYFSGTGCTSERPSRCSCEDWDKIASGLFAHEDPIKYWRCDKGKREELTCPYGTKWSQAYESCQIE